MTTRSENENRDLTTPQDGEGFRLQASDFGEGGDGGTERLRPPALQPSEEPEGESRSRRLLSLRADREAERPAAVRLRDRAYKRLLALADILAATLALLVSVALLGDGDVITIGAVLTACLIVPVSKILGLYDRDPLLLRKTTLDEAPVLFQLATVSALLLWLGHGAFVDGMLGRDQVLGFWIGLFLLLLACRMAVRAAAGLTVPVENVLLMGDPTACTRTREKIEGGGGIHARVVGQIEFESAMEADDAAAALAVVAGERQVHRVLIAPPSSQGEVLDLIRAAKGLGLNVSVLPRMLEVVGSAVEFDDIDGVQVLGVRRFGLTRSSLLIKRLMDIAGSLAALLLLGPAMAAVAVAIKLDSRGPVFFRQQRVGRGGRMFQMIKFRTMVADAESLRGDLEHLNEAEGLFKIAEDPRITRVGRFLRATSLDEIPQLINVLRGEMSLVGPRPLVLEEDRRVEGWYRRRLDLTPGMTGRWQVLGSARIPLQEMATLDYLYVANWSLWGDVKILLRTLPFVLRRRGL